jgi:pyruvate,water dikinase
MMFAGAAMSGQTWVVGLSSVGRGDIACVGGKNASTGEMLRSLASHGVRVPEGFATTSDAFKFFVEGNQLGDAITVALQAHRAGKVDLATTGARIRAAVLGAEWPPALRREIANAYSELCASSGAPELSVAVRSSATAEDLPTASFAGQLESFLNIRGEAALLEACKKCFASLYTDRAINYRIERGFEDKDLAVSVGVQRMVRSDLAGAGVMFSIDTETGFDKVVVINAALGLGESVVQGAVDPDEYQVFKPFLENEKLTPIIEKACGAKELKVIYRDSGGTLQVVTRDEERGKLVLLDDEILLLARWACAIESHYGVAMDMEWAKDGLSGELFVVQARPETVQSRRGARNFKTYRVRAKGKVLARGLSVGNAAAAGRVCRLDSPAQIDRFVDGAVLVTKTTDPDWAPIMKRASAIVTEHGGRTSHAAIVSRELGLPAIVGAGEGVLQLGDGAEVTVSCAEGNEGFVYEGRAEIETIDIASADLPPTKTKVMLNLGDPGAAFQWWRLPADGVGLARMEFVIANHIKVHPMALLGFEKLQDQAAKAAIAAATQGYANKAEFLVDKLSRGLARLAAVAWPHPIIVRTSDFKTNEYAHLLGGAEFEPKEENPMLGFRGASRYYSPAYRDGFGLECQALKRLRQELGFSNVVVMIPFCRTPSEADRVLAAMAENGLARGDGLEVYVMCEIPANVIRAEEFAQRFDGFSIGSNDLTQLVLGVDRGAAALAELFDESDAAVKAMIADVIARARKAGAKTGLCGQAPSDDPTFAAFLVSCGIDSISVSPDSFVAVKQSVAAAEAAILRQSHS